MTDPLRAALDSVESRHRQGDHTEEGWVGNSIDGIGCSGCGERWPCSATRLRLAADTARPGLDDLDGIITETQLEADLLARLRDTARPHGGCNGECDCYFRGKTTEWRLWSDATKRGTP